MADRPNIEPLVKACGKYVRTYSGIRNLEKLYRNGSVVVAEIDNEIIGFAVAPHLVKKPWTSIYEIGVHPDHQRQGIGRQFIFYIVENSPYRHVRLVCDARNTQGLHFYADLGFKNVGKRQNRSGETIFDLALKA
jgi:ribosomal protein S18 acetylase RimI-like enzyme